MGQWSTAILCVDYLGKQTRIPVFSGYAFLSWADLKNELKTKSKETIQLRYTYRGSVKPIDSARDQLNELCAALDEQYSRSSNKLHCQALEGQPGVIHILSFPSFSTPSLSRLLTLVRGKLCLPDDETSLDLLLVEAEGSRVKIDDEAVWARVGWPRAKKVYFEGQRKGDWTAQVFQAGLPSLPSYTPAPSVEVLL
ncbi:hypothetical protein JCM8547_001963 [Rhodosporidiobolus lusitaniae]